MPFLPLPCSSFPPYDVFQQVIATKSFAIIQPDVGYAGGISAFLRVAAAAKAAGRRRMLM